MILQLEENLNRIGTVMKNLFLVVLTICLGSAAWSETVNNLSVKPFVVKADENWLPFYYDRKTQKGSILDFSFLLDAPAGKYGFLRSSSSGEFEFEKRRGVPVRFFGGNICFGANFLKKEICDEFGDMLSFMGYNLLRLHHFDGVLAKLHNGKSSEFDPRLLNQLDYLVYAMKKRGIYITLDLYSSRTVGPGEIKEFPDREVGPGAFKALVFISPSAMENWKNFSEKLLNHVNPYTGLAWKNDPAIVTMCLINEDVIFFCANQDREVKALYEKKFREYTKKNGIIVTAENRSLLWDRFLSEIYLRGYREMKNFMRKLGVKALLTDQNMWSRLPLALIRHSYDFVDNHAYWQHPEFPGKPWQLPMKTGNRSAVSAHVGFLSFFSRLYGKPFTVTEWDFVRPNYSVEGAWIMGAYASLQNWNGICRFALSHSAARIEREVRPTEIFDLLDDPQRQLSERAAALFYLRGDVHKAINAYSIVLPFNYLDRPDAYTGYPNISQLGLISRVGISIADGKRTPAWPVGLKAVFAPRGMTISAEATQLTFPDTPSLNELAQMGLLEKSCIGGTLGSFTSDTGEITINSRQETLQICTSFSEGFVLSEKSVLHGNFASVENKIGRGSFLFASMDGKPLIESERVLIMHLTETRNSGMRFRDETCEIIEDWGNLPYLAARGSAVITLKCNPALRLFRCNTDGRRMGEITVSRTQNGIYFNCENFIEKNPVFIYELTK